MSYGILGPEQKQELLDVVRTIYPDIKINELNTSSFTHSLVLNLCTNSSVENGLCFSEDCFQVLKLVKQFNYTLTNPNYNEEATIQYYKHVSF